MSDDGFNPYHEWLGLDRSVTQPNYYQLLGLDPAEQSPQQIAQAANRATARVRSCRPGLRGPQWAKLLEEITAAASCLSDPTRRGEYDRQSGRGGAARSYNRPAPRSRVTPTAGGSSAPNALPLQGPASAALPMPAPQGVPAAYSPSPAGPATYLDPMAPVVPAGPTAAVPGYGQASGYGAGAMPPTSSLPSYPAARGYPAQGAATPAAAAPGVGGYGYPAPGPRGGISGGVPAGAVPVGVPLRPVSATPAPVAGKELSASAKVRQRTKTSSLTVIAASAGVGMVILAGAIVLVILSQKSDDRGRKTYGSSVQDRPIVHVPSSPRETFHRPTPPPRQPRPVERKPRLFGARSEAGNDASDAALSAAIGPGLPVPVAEPSPPSTGQVPERVEVLTEPTFSAPSGKPPVGSPPAGMAEAKSPTDSSLSLPAFPAGPTLPSTDTAAAPQPNPTAPSESPAVPPQPKEAMPDETPPPQSPPQPPPSEFKPALSNTKPEPPKPAEATSVSPAVKPAEVAALATALKAAHAAILNREYDAAAAELNKAEALPKSPEDHAKYERLTLLAGYAKNFQSALKSAVAGLHPGDEIEVGSSTVVGFVSAAKDSITLRVTGANRTYALDSLPAGLAIAIADRWLKKDDPVSLAMKGAYVAALKDVDEERKARARQWLEEASKKGVEGELHKVLDDTYDSEPAGK